MKLPETAALQPVNTEVESGFRTGKPALAQDYTGDIFHCESTLNQLPVLRGTYLDFGCLQYFR